MTQEDKYIKENNLDEIDAFLFKEFGILGGACSTQMALEYCTARKVAEKLWKKKEPVSEDLEEAARKYGLNNPTTHFTADGIEHDAGTPMLDFIAGANWQKGHSWHEAQGNDLPEIDREVIALQGRKVVFAHRPPEYWDGKNIDTGEVTRHYPQTYDKGGWNMPGVTYWLDAPLPEGIE